MLDWGLTAAAALLFLYAVRVLFMKGKQEETAKLGCGFGIAAAILWTWVLSRHVDDTWTPVRIGIGVLLLLPAAQALSRPKGASLLKAVVGLVLAFVIAGPAVQTLWREWGPDRRPESVRRLDEKLGELHAARAELDSKREALIALRGKVQAEVKQLGSSWEELRSNETALQKLEILRRVDEQLLATESALATLDERIPELEARLAQASELTAPSGPDAEVDALLRELQSAPALDDLTTVEQYAREKELQELYEREVRR